MIKWTALQIAKNDSSKNMNFNYLHKRPDYMLPKIHASFNYSQAQLKLY